MVLPQYTKIMEQLRTQDVIENATQGVGYPWSDKRIPRGLLDDSEFSIQLALASLEFKTAFTLSKRKEIREDINRMGIILERYAEHGLLHLVARDFPTVQSIADTLSDMRY